MYAETGLLYPYYHQGCSQEIQFQHCFQGTNGRGNPFQTSSVSEYDLGGEGDLFKAPEPLAAIVEEPLLDLDPMFASILSVEDDMPPHSIQIADMAPVQNDPLFSVDFYECKKELLAKSAIKESLAEVSEVKLPAVHMEEVFCAEKDKVLEGAMQKSVSSSCLTSMEWVNGGPVRPNFLDFQGFDLGAALGLRRAHSEGDIRTLGSVNTPVLHPPLERVPTEDREQKLLRYRNKKTKRNFGRKIKYACRKALADSQPRVRGRFARSEEAEVSHTIK